MFDCTKTVKEQHTAGCLHCGVELTQTQGAGRVRRYCTQAHGRLWRRRMRHAGWL
ncbi:hypothetical protein [Streptomyces sp. NPDC088794]|uniref:hypothetical protein n=1 Tax=Streptomyces sp. NPDC088794 TaxID=3365902 RepID=UPI0038093EE8